MSLSLLDGLLYVLLHGGHVIYAWWVGVLCGLRPLDGAALHCAQGPVYGMRPLGGGSWFGALFFADCGFALLLALAAGGVPDDIVKE